jgi:hypothetical protein
MRKLVIATVLILYSSTCQQKQPQSESNESASFQAERNIFFNSLKTPGEMASLAIPEVIQYNSDLLADPANYTRYLDHTIKSAANLGIYISDLNYNLLFGKKEATKEYFMAAHELSKAIGIEQRILQFLSMRYSANIEQSDSVKRIVNELLEQSTITLQGTDHERMAGVAIAAYQIENLYLTLAALESIPEQATEEQNKVKQQLIDYLISYQANIEVSYNFIHSYADPLNVSDHPNFPFFDTALHDLIVVYRTLNRDSVSDQTMKELKNNVETIRSKIISM